MSGPRPSPGLRLKARGFTLVETLVALVVAEVAVLGAMGMATTALARMNRTSALESNLVRVHAVWDSLSRSGSVNGRDSADRLVISWVIDSLDLFTITARVPGADSFAVRGAVR